MFEARWHYDVSIKFGSVLFSVVFLKVELHETSDLRSYCKQSCKFLKTERNLRGASYYTAISMIYLVLSYDYH